jgi:jumonji domain-containing protein 2
MLSPSILKKAGIGYSCQIQRAGDVMITFPGSYHFGFNTGFNVAESTNFAVPEWVPSGVAAGVCMCHPHSVRIDMNRFTTLLRKYDREMAAADKKGEPRISYSKWAKLEAKRRVDNAQESDSEDDMGNANTITFRKGRVVEVMRWVPEKSLYHGEYASKKKPPKSSKKVIEDEDDWRMALRVKASMFTPGTPVLCFLPGDNGPGSEMKEKYFTGTVSQVVERHARCHFANTPRKDDIWLAVDGHQLFMDGGSAEPPAGASVKITSKRQSGAKAVTAKKKLRT